MSDGIDESLREGWVPSSLGRVSDLISGVGFPINLQGQQGLQFPFFKVGSLAGVQSGQPLQTAKDTIDERTAAVLKAKIIPPSAILFAKIGMAIRLNRRRVVSVPCCIDNNLMAAIPNASVDERYLLRWLETVDFMPLASATTVPSIRKSELESVLVPLPPLAEQRRIVGKVEALLARVQAARQRLARVPLLLKRFRQAVLTAACNGQLTSDWREQAREGDTGVALVERMKIKRHKRLQELQSLAPKDRPISLSDLDNVEPTVRSDLELPDLPEEWVWVDLRFLMAPDEPFCYGVVQPGLDEPEGPRLIRVCDIEGGTVQVNQCRGISDELHSQYSRSILRGGEVLVSVVGTIGRSAVAPPDVKGFNIARAVAKIPIRDVSERFVNYWLGTSLTQAWMIDDAREVARKTLNLEQLRTLPCPVPSLAEQHEIVRRVDALFQLADAIERRVAAATARAERLTQAILAKAFRGELVPTEAELARAENRNYEPADVLLQRILGSGNPNTTASATKERSRRGRKVRSQRL